MKYKVLFFIIIAVALFISLVGYLMFGNKTVNSKIQTSQAANSSATLTSKDDWEAGTISGLTSTSSPGDLKIDFSAPSKFVGGTITTTGSGDPETVRDGNLSTGITFTNRNQNLTWDLGGSYTFAKLRYYTNTADIIIPVQVYYGGSWHTVTVIAEGGGPGFAWWKSESTILGVSKVRLVAYDYGIDWSGVTAPINEFEVYTQGSSGTHISGAAQIKDTNLYQWQTFKPTFTYSGTSANTTIQFQFRSGSTTIGDCSDVAWNDWTSYQTIPSDNLFNLVTLGLKSYSGSETDPGTFYKCLQVETKMTSSDGSSTPVLDKYEIGYHTNVAPSKPVAGSVIIGN